MNPKTILIAVPILIVLGGGYYYLSRNSNQPAYQPPPPPPATGIPTPTPTPPARLPDGQAAGATHTIVMNANGFSPSNLTVKVGDTVVFDNRDTRSRWPASGVHPTHLLCPGFDALGPLAPGETYSHTFTLAKDCPMHDHLMPTLKGTITVTE